MHGITTFRQHRNPENEQVFVRSPSTVISKVPLLSLESILDHYAGIKKSCFRLVLRNGLRLSIAHYDHHAFEMMEVAEDGHITTYASVIDGDDFGVETIMASDAHNRIIELSRLTI